MVKHREIIAPKFAEVERILTERLGGLGVAEWTQPDRRLLRQPRRPRRHRLAGGRAGQGGRHRADARRLVVPLRPTTRATATSGWRRPSRAWPRSPAPWRRSRPACCSPRPRRSPAEGADSGDAARSSRRRTCIFTSPAPCGTPPCSSSPSATGTTCPRRCVEDWPPQLSAADEKGWFRFQRLYDVARSVLRTEDDVRRLVREAAEDDKRDGGRWLEIQVDPSGYAAKFGGITAFTDLVLDAVAGGLARRRHRDGRGDRRQPHPAPAGRPHAGPPRRAVRRPRRGRLRPVQRRAARQHPRLRAGLRHRRARRPAARPARRRAARAPTQCGSASRTCTPTGSGTASASPRTPTCST